MSLLMLILVVPISNLTESANARLAIMALSPTVLLTSVLSAYRGYFQGRGNMTPTAISQVFEQIANTVFSLIFAACFIKFGVEAGLRRPRPPDPRSTPCRTKDRKSVV